MTGLTGLVLGWFLGIFSKLISDSIGDIKRRRGVARALEKEISHFTDKMREEISCMTGLEKLPSTISPIYKTTYNMDFYECFKSDFSLFSPVTIELLSEYYSLIRYIDDGKQYIRHLIREGISSKSASIKEIFDSEISLRQDVIRISYHVLIQIKNESAYKPKLIKKAIDLFLLRNKNIFQKTIALIGLVAVAWICASPPKKNVYVFVDGAAPVVNVSTLILRLLVPILIGIVLFFLAGIKKKA